MLIFLAAQRPPRWRSQGDHPGQVGWLYTLGVNDDQMTDAAAGKQLDK
jgi:hypothetical protein